MATTPREIIVEATHLAGAGRLRDAENLLRASFPNPRHTPDAAVLLGRILFQQSRYAEAEPFLRVGPDPQPARAERGPYLAACLTNLRRNEEGLAAVRRALALDPT